VAADKLDARPRWDLAPLVMSLAEGYEQLKQYDKELDACREYIEMMEFLIRRDPQSSTYKEAYAESLIKYATVLNRLGQREEGEKAGNEGVSIILSMVRKPDAETNELALATNALITLHPSARQDGALALSLAQREIASSSEVTVDQLLDLAEAQHFAGRVADSRATAEQALKLQLRHPKSMGSTANFRKIAALLR
jgi:tetratricopeptide (TPR) repeat protein